MTMQQQTDPAAPGNTQPAPPRALLRLVYIMGIVLVLLFLLLIGGLVWKAQTRKPAPAPADIAAELGIDPARIRLMDLDGNLLALTTDTELVVVDVIKQRILLRLPKQ